MSLFGGKKNPNLEHITQALHDTLGLTLIQPTEDVLRAINGITPRELINFDNAHSVEGMQELFKAKSIRAVADTGMKAVSLFLLPPDEIEKELRMEHSQTHTIHVGERHATQQIIKPMEAPQMIATGLPAQAKSTVPAAPVPPAFEHLEALERLCPALVDLFVKNGQLNTGDKDVLKKILPMDSSLEARIVALERWQAEVTRRCRAMSMPNPAQFLVVTGEAVAQAKPEEMLVRRFDTLVSWVGKLIKAFEGTGVKCHIKPMWLPH